MGSSLSSYNLSHQVDANVIACANSLTESDLSTWHSSRNPWLILHDVQEEESVGPTRIEQQVYFYNVDSGVLYEMYTVNGVATKRYRI